VRKEVRRALWRVVEGGEPSVARQKRGERQVMGGGGGIGVTTERG